MFGAISFIVHLIRLYHLLFSPLADYNTAEAVNLRRARGARNHWLEVECSPRSVLIPSSGAKIAVRRWKTGILLDEYRIALELSFWRSILSHEFEIAVLCSGSSIPILQQYNSSISSLTGNDERQKYSLVFNFETL